MESKTNMPESFLQKAKPNCRIVLPIKIKQKCQKVFIQKAKPNCKKDFLRILNPNQKSQKFPYKRQKKNKCLNKNK